MTIFSKKYTMILGLLLTSSVVFSAPFELAFRIVKITGECAVKKANASSYEPAVEGQAYAYGSAVRTGRKSTAVVKLSEGNECRILSKADFVMAENADNPKLKTIKVQEGKIEISLDPSRHESGNDLNVETATAVCGAVGSLFTVEVQRESGVNVLVVFCTEGELKLEGSNFSATKVLANCGLSISGDDNNNFTRIKCLKGNFTLSYKDADGNVKEVVQEANAIVKIWRRQSDAGNVVIITVIITDPDGTTHPAEVFTEQMQAGQQKSMKPIDKIERIDTGNGVLIIKITTSSSGSGSTTVITVETEDGVTVSKTTTSSKSTISSSDDSDDSAHSVTPIGQGRS